MTCRQAVVLGVSAAALLAVGTLGIGQDRPKVGFKDTPMLPGGKWHVHDGDRPFPPVVTPGTSSTQQEPGRAPSDAVVLFDGKDLSHWRGRRGQPAKWKVEDGAMVITPGGGEITSTDEFGDCQLHLEFAAPVPARGRDQGRGNSGVMFFGRYEIQVLDSFENVTYADGQAAADLRAASAAGECVAAARPVASVRHHLHGTEIQAGRFAGLARVCHDAAQRRAGA